MDRWIDVGSSSVIISETFKMYAIEVDGGDEEGGDLKGTVFGHFYTHYYYFFSSLYISFMCACVICR